MILETCMNKKVSIITPFYNSKGVFDATLKSVLSQTYPNWEWIIVDDCSTDGSIEYLKRIQNKDKRIRIVFSSKNGGSAVARNKGLGIASGRYITFLDSDDTIEKNYLESQVEFIKDNGPLITAGYRRKKGGNVTAFMPRDEITFKEALKGNDMSCLTTMFDQEAIGKVKFHEDFLRDEDYVFWLEILKRDIVCRTNKSILATYYLRENSKNSIKIRLFKPRFNVYHKVLGYNIIKSLWLVFRYFIYGRKKYRKVK